MNNNYDELLEIACRMSQELQELIDDAQEAGSDLPATRELLEDWNEVYKNTPLYWQSEIGDGECGIASLEE